MTTTLLSGLSVGALYAVFALLMTIPLIRSGVQNFAQPFYVVLAGFVASELLTVRGWNTLVVIGVLAAVGAGLGLVQEIVVMRPLRGRHDGELIAIVGLAVSIEGLIQVVWGPDPRSVKFFGGEQIVTIFGGKTQPVSLWIIGLAIVGAFALEGAVRLTRWGLVGRAAMADQELAALRGLNPTRMRTAGLALTGTISGVFAMFAAPMTGVSGNVALRLVIYAFTAAAIGGFGHPTGALLGGLMLGLVEALSARFLGAEYGSPIVFALLAVVLFTMPQGVLGRRAQRVV